MLVSGHEGEIYSGKFHPDGYIMATAGSERLIYIWNVFGECENIFVYKGAHKGAILDLQFNVDGTCIYTASTDKTVGLFDIETGEKIKRMKGHNGIVNACSVSRRGNELGASARDDCTVKIWDSRRRSAIKSFQSKYQVTSISLSHNGHHVLSNSMDCTLRQWDVRPFAPKQRCVSVFHGHRHDFEKNLLKCSWSPDDSKIAAGSADRNVYVWNVSTYQLIYKLPGHAGSVNDVQFHPHQPIIMSCSSDKQIYLGEIQ